jgi:hypothetical protein
VGVLGVACGARTEGPEQIVVRGVGGDVLPDTSGGTATGAGGRSTTGGRATAASGGRFTTGSGGFAARGAGGIILGAGGISRGSGGSIFGSGGAVSGTGGRPTLPPGDARLVPYVCLEPCSLPKDCPSADPYAGGCNDILHTCLITCEKGCPPGTEAVSASGGCFCYDPRVNTTPGSCCSSYCGPPLHLPCCNGTSCRPDGTCCDGSSCP